MEVSCWKGEPTNLEPHKHSELAWFDKDLLPPKIFYLNKLALEDIKHGKFYGEHGWDL